MARKNLVGALRTCMGAVGAQTIKELQLTEIVIAPAIQHEGKIFQKGAACRDVGK